MSKPTISKQFGLSPLVADLVAKELGQSMAKSERKTKISVGFSDMVGIDDNLTEEKSLSKSFTNLLNGNKNSIERLAFEADPSLNNTYQALYHQKTRLIPDTILKRIAIQDDLVASIITARTSQMSVFGRPREDRHSAGFVIEPKKGVVDDLSDQQKEELKKRTDRAVELLATCGNTKGWNDREQLTLSQWISQSVRNALIVGRLATEIIWVPSLGGDKKFHSFRPIDAGTIYRAAAQKDAAQSVREQARHLLQQIKNKKLEPEKFENDEYAWVQVIDGRPVQAFASDECLVHNFYPVPDIELDGYPVTPLDTVMSAVSTHINITTHNKLYFQSGRASRGMLLIKSDDVDENTVGRIRQQFNASINNVNNSWRMPVFAVGTDDEVAWSPIDSGARDMEFQYLSDMNARTILSAFQISPEELPGYSYLSRGTNSQSLSEGNLEYQLEAHRDLGIRPLIKHFEDFLNQRILPLIDKSLSSLCTIRLTGLDAETPEKENVGIQQWMPVHGTYNEVMDKVEKKPIDKKMGGDFPLNPQIQAVLDKYVPVGQILEYFLGVPGAAKDPNFNYVRDPFYFQNIQLQMQMQQMQQQAQMAQQQAAQAPQGGGGGEQGGPAPEQSQSQGQPQEGGPKGGFEQAQEGSPTEKQANQQMEESLHRSIDQAITLLSKGEKQLDPKAKKILAHHTVLVNRFVSGFAEDMEKTNRELLRIARRVAPTGK